MTTLRWLAGFMLALLVATAGAQEFVPVPPLQKRVTDKAGMLTENQEATLENVLKDYEERTGSQIAILLVSKTEPEAIEQYSIRVFDTWKLGRKGVDDGVLLIVAKNNPPSLRRMRIEAGRGVQGSLTDAQSKRILQDVIAPHFRQNDFYGGLAAGVSAITSLLDKEQFPAPRDSKQAQQAVGDDEESDAFSFGLFVFFVILFLLMSRMRSRQFARHRHSWGRATPGVILGGGFGHGGFGGGGFGGGGFGGGGGSADGGGASGNW